MFRCRNLCTRLALSESVSKYKTNLKFASRAWERICAVNYEEKTHPQRPLRLEISSGGCHGFIYQFKFEKPVASESNGANSSSNSNSHSSNNSSSSNTTNHNDEQVPDYGIDTEEDIIFENDDVPFTPLVPREESSSNRNGSSSNSEDLVKKYCLSRIVIDKATIERIEGAQIDYHSELKGSAFVVVGNEKVDASCSCGMSISLK